MATLVLDNTLYQCYATIAEQNNINVTDDMTEALRLLKQQLKKKPSLSLNQRLEKRILEFRDLPANWDYEGYPSISSEACDYSQKVVASCSESILQGLKIFPNTNGNILMQWKTFKGDVEFYVSLSRMSFIDQRHLNNTIFGRRSTTCIFISYFSLLVWSLPL